MRPLVHMREERGDDRTSNVSPGVTDHPQPRALISAVVLQAFAEPHHCVHVQRAASGTEARKCIRSRARSRGSTESRVESSTRRILRLSTEAGDRRGCGRPREQRSIQNGIGTRKSGRPPCRVIIVKRAFVWVKYAKEVVVNV